MKHLLITTIAAVLVVGCGESQQSATSPETKPEPPTAKAPDISIHIAAMQGNLEAVKQHIAAGTDVNAKDRDDWPPLLKAAWHGHKEIAELLIAKGADVNARDSIGGTPLHKAALRGRKEIAELLIANGADVNAKDILGKTPLDWANMGYKGEPPEDKAVKKEIADLLRKHGGKTGEELKAEEK
jgi:hypothetical protein